MTETTNETTHTCGTETPAKRSGTAGSTVIVFLAFHLVVIGGGLAWGVVRYRALHAETVPREPLETPLRITGLRDDADVVSDEQLRTVLTALRPKLRGPNPKINFVDHALRFWGLPARFDDPQCYSGEEMLGLLTDHRQFSRSWEDGTRPFLDLTEHGVRYRVKRGHATASHTDHTLATLAEIGLPLNYPVVTPDGEARVADMFRRARHDFELNQPEYEWSAIVMSLYAPYSEPWMTTEGQWVDFNVLAARMMRERLTRGVCFGNHRLFGLAVLLRVDETHDILNDATRDAVVEHLRDVTRRLVENQDEDGAWDRNWDGSEHDFANEAMPARSRRLLATGHALEWWAIAPDSVQPPREVVVRAGQWLCRTVTRMTESEIAASYPFLTHVGRALALWRKTSPAAVVRAD